MIIIKLTGGLGNQLFQYSYGRALSLERNEKLLVDDSWYKGRLNRSYMLQHFKISAGKANFLHRIFCKKSYLQDLTGEWHSEKHFKKYEDVIRKELTLTTDQKLSSENSVSIHLRGTDYVRGNKSAFHGTCTPEYYSRAIEDIRQKVSNSHFYIFTDDIEWAKNHIAFPEPFTLVSDTTKAPHVELALMSSCRHNIIANSTFSWWAAWLNPNPGKIVVAPKKWFADEKASNSDILPSSWIQM